MALPVHFYDFWGATLFVLICDSFSLAKTAISSLQNMVTFCNLEPAFKVEFDPAVTAYRCRFELGDPQPFIPQVSHWPDANA